MSAASMFDHCSFTHQFKLNYEDTKNLDIREPISSGDISAGGYLWMIECYPRVVLEEEEEEKEEEDNGDDNDEYLSIFLELVSKTFDVGAIFEAFVMGRDGAPSSSYRHSLVHVFKKNDSSRGWAPFIERSVLESRYVASDGCITIMCGVKVAHHVPPSDIGWHLGVLLDSKEDDDNAATDVSFVVAGEAFLAHRAMLGARSPVFKALLAGSMADGDNKNMVRSITLQDIAPATFKAMLMFMFMYTDDLLATEGFMFMFMFMYTDDLLATEGFQDLLAAADRFALDRMKLLCAKRLWDDVSADTVGATLACAMAHNCPELKKKCIDFFADEKNFKAAVLTDGFAQLVQKFPTILAELKVKVGE